MVSGTSDDLGDEEVLLLVRSCFEHLKHGDTRSGDAEPGGSQSLLYMGHHRGQFIRQSGMSQESGELTG